MAAAACFCVPVRGQEAQAIPVGDVKITGVIDDWAHHHVVFSDPGTEADAIKNGRYNQWLKIVNDSRYQMQQLKRGSTVPQPTIVAPTGPSLGRSDSLLTPVDDGGLEGRFRGPVKSPRFELRRFSILGKDWSMDDGNFPAASLTITVSSAPASGTVSGSSTITVDGQEFTGSAPVAASRNGTFTGDATSGQTVTIGGSEVLTASDSTPSSQMGTFSSSPSTTDTITVVNGANTFSATTNATLASFRQNFTTGTAASGSMTITYSASGTNNVLTMTAGGSNGCTSATLGTFATSTTASTEATNFETAINDCDTSFPAVGVTATHTGTAVYATVTEVLPGTFLTGSDTGLTNGTISNVAAGSDGSASCNAATGHYATSNSTTTLASDLAAMFEACSAANAATIGINPSASTIALNGSGGITVQADLWGSTPGVTLTPTATGFFQWAAGTMTGGTDGTNSGTDFAIVNNNTTDAANLASAITLNGGTVGVTATSTGAVVTVTANTAGTGGNSITTAEGLTGFSFGGAKLAGGSNGTNSATTFKYWTTNTYDTEDQLATDLATAFGDNATMTAAITAAASTNTVVLTSILGGTPGNSYTASDSGFTTLTIPNSGDFSGGVGSIPVNTFPAKYSFSTNTASCSSDFVVYPTGLAGSSSQATIVGYKNLYATTCTTGSVPSVAFAYNTGGTATLSPVLSLDGTQIAYIQTSSSVATLVLLKPSLTSGGTISSPAPIPGGAVSLSAYPNCTAPCYTTITLNGSPNDTNSSPYYDYNTAGGDILWVGDNSGNVHNFNPVFFGSTTTPPAETTTNWPVTASTEASPILTSPIYDSVSENIFVGDASGYLHSVSSTGTVLTSNQIECGTYGFVDAPVVDSSTENVYVFVGDGCDEIPGNSYVNRFEAGTSISASYGANAASFGNASTNDTGTVQYSGDFDNEYYTGTGNTGNLYVCVNGALYQITMATFSGTGTPTVNSYDTPVSTVADEATCSPVTEFYNGTDDWLFLSVAANGDATGCTGSCLYNYNVEGAGTTGSVTTGQSAAGGTTGIVVDNNLTGSGESQIYYTTLSNQTCNGSSAPVVGNGKGSCAIQASQSAP